MFCQLLRYHKFRTWHFWEQNLSIQKMFNKLTVCAQGNDIMSYAKDFGF